jgi:hypothetical protein
LPGRCVGADVIASIERSPCAWLRGLASGDLPQMRAEAADCLRRMAERATRAFAAMQRDGAPLRDQPLDDRLWLLAFLSRRLVVSIGLSLCSRLGGLGLLAQVLLRNRGQQGEEDAESGEDVEDREDLRPSEVGERLASPTVVNATTAKYRASMRLQSSKRQ